MSDGSLAAPGIRRRLASALYDLLLLVGVLSATFVLPHVVIGLLFHVTLHSALLLAHFLAVLSAYYLWYWRHGGQTLAMQTWKIRLVSVSGGTPTWPQLLLRYLLAWPSIGFYGAGILWAFFDRDRQFLHDRLAGTRIICKQ
jgi:uncharacterized RDD family membrane protein YckC